MLPKSRMQSTQRARERRDVESRRTIGNLVRYPAIMREDVLRRFFLGQVPVSGLAQDGQWVSFAPDGLRPFRMGR